jgi:hypothetical protein
MKSKIAEARTALTKEQLENIVVENVQKLFDADSRDFIEGYLNHVVKEKAAAQSRAPSLEPAP